MGRKIDRSMGLKRMSTAIDFSVKNNFECKEGDTVGQGESHCQVSAKSLE